MSRFAARNRDLSSNNIFGCLDSPDRSATLRDPKGFQHNAFKKEDYQRAAPSTPRSELMKSSADVRAAFGASVSEAEAARPASRGAKENGVPNLGQRHVRQAWADRPDPIVEGSPETVKLHRRPVPEYWQKHRAADEFHPSKGRRQNPDPSAAGTLNSARDSGFKPSRRLVSQPESREEERTSHRAQVTTPSVEAAGHDPIAQAEEVYKPESPKAGIRVFPARSNTETERERPLTHRRLIRDNHASKNPITGDVVSAPEHAHGTRRFPNKRQDHGDVISYKFAGGAADARPSEASNFKVGDIQRTTSYQEKLDNYLHARAQNHRQYVLNRAKSHAAHAAMSQYIYDDPTAVP